VRLAPEATGHSIGLDQLDAVLASREVDVGRGKVRLDEASMRSLMKAGSATAVIREGDAAGSLVRLEVEGWESSSPPVANGFVVQDLAEFLAAPVVPGRDGTMIEVPLDARAVRELRDRGELTLPLNGSQVLIKVLDARRPVGPQYGGLAWLSSYVLTGRRAYYQKGNVLREVSLDPSGSSYSSDGGLSTSSPTPEPKFSTVGLPVAVLLPWKQTWQLVGFTRGNLLSSLALAPGEETTITVASWERRAKALDQTAETDVEQTFDFSSSTRDTEDVFKEVVQSNEFTSQAHASLDASYSPGFASISVHADGSVTNDESLAVTARTSSQHVRETTTRASTRVRSRRVTRIVESAERTSSNEVVRTIRNPNRCHTLTLNFHEVLAHYDVKIKFNPAAVRMVVLVPNPEPTKVFTELTARVHEATLRAGLLDAALADGFEACRLLAAYEYAEKEIRRLAGLAKQELDQERPKVPPPPGEQKPKNPHLPALTAILADLKRRYQPFPAAEGLPALKALQAGKTHTAEQVSAENRWLWKRLVAAKFGTGLLVALGDLTGQVTPGPEDARRLLAAVPSLGSFPALDALGSLPDKDKEDSGLYGTVSALGGPWFWWYPNLKDNGFYNVIDAGIPGLLGQLRTKFQEWESKEAEGEGVERAEAAVARAQDEQQKTTVADRLEMKFGAEMVGAAIERRQALLAHLNAHVDYYRFVLFQAMPPSEQLQQLMATAPQLRVGMFEPHVVSCDGPNLAVPLTPLAETTISKVVKNLSDRMKQATEAALGTEDRMATDRTILTTPGVSVESWVGACGGCEAQIEKLRGLELRREEAAARQQELEADRFAARLTAKLYDDPSPDPPLPVEVRVDQNGDS
jgi:hypothetical protein